MNEQEKQRRIDAWFENFMEQVGQHPFSVNPELAVDVGRIYKTLDQPRNDGAEMECPIGERETLYDKRNELYQLASEGKLYIFPLAEEADCRQIRAESEGRLLYDLNEVAAQPATRKPVEQKLGAFKGFFNMLFGWFEAERVQLAETYENALRAYNYRQNGVKCKNSNIRTMGDERLQKMGAGQELGRLALPSTIKTLREKLETQDMPRWERDCNEARLQLFTAMEAGTPLERSQASDIIAKVMVARMGEYKDKEMYQHQKATEMQRLLHEEPEKAYEYIDAIKADPYIRSIVEKDDLFVVFSVASNVQGTDMLTSRWLRNLENGTEQQKAMAADIRQMTDTRIDTIESLNKDIEDESRFHNYFVDQQTTRAKLELLTAQQEGKSLSPEQCQDILAKLIVGRMGIAATDIESRQPNELRDLLRADPKKVEEMTEVVKNTKFVKDMAQRADLNEIVNNTRTIKALDQLVKGVLNEVKVLDDQRVAGEKVNEIAKEQVKDADQLQNQPKSLGAMS